MINKEEIQVLNKDVEIYTIENEYMRVSFMNYGGAILQMSLKDKDQSENIAVRYEDLSSYFGENGPCLNALIGPIAGRIQYGEYEVDGKSVTLPINNGLNHLHGGEEGLQRQFFQVEVHEDTAILKLVAKHVGFEGVFEYEIVYKLEDTTFSIQYQCRPSVRQVVNLTNHIYVNLDGNIKRGIENHYLKLPSRKKVEIHPDGYPYQIVEVEEGSAFDFTTMKKLGDAYLQGDKEFEYTKGIDAPFLLESGKIMLYNEETELELTIDSDQEAVVVYTANYFDASQLYEFGCEGFEHAAIALETQTIPNGIHIEGAYDSIHDYEHPYRQYTKYTLTRR